MSALAQRRWLGPLLATAALWIGLSLTTPRFLSWQNFSTLLEQFSITAVLACGMTFVILSGGIDLSVGSIVGISGAVAAMVMPGQGVWIGCLVGLGAGIAAGTLNGACIAYGRIAPFIVTLGTMGIARSLTLVVLQGRSLSKLPDSFVNFDFSHWFALPAPTWLVFALYFVGVIALVYGSFGRVVFALGGNERAARLSGVPTNRMKVIIYAICGATAGIAGLMTTARVASAQPQAGSFDELTAIAAVVVGGTSLTGGIGSLQGTLIGAFLLQTIQSGLNQHNVDPFWQQAVVGLAIILAALLDSLTRWRSRDT